MASCVRPGLAITAGLMVIATAVTGCGSGTPHPASSPSGRVDPSHGSVTPSSGPATPAGLIAAPKAFQALPLLKAAGLAAALGTPVKGFQDDGGTASSSGDGFISVAETESRLTHFRVSLQSYANPAAAMQAYSQLASSGGTPLPGIGDKALDVAATQVVVLKSSQVLVVQVDLTPAGIDYIGQNDKSPASLMAALDNPARAAARALVPQLTQAAVAGKYLQLPAGALDPCALSTKAIAAGTKQDVAAVNMPSENRPAQQCDISIGTSRYLVQTYTEAQAASAVPATTLTAVYGQDEQVRTPGERVHTESAHLMAFMNIDTDFVFEVLVTGASTMNFRAAPETAHQALIRIKNAYTAPVSREQCYELGKQAAMQLVVGMPEAEAKQFFDELVDWCSKFPSGGGS